MFQTEELVNTREESVDGVVVDAILALDLDDSVLEARG